MNYVFDTMTDCIISELQSNPCFASPIVINNILMFFQTLGSIFGDADVGPRDGEELPEAWTRHGQHVEQGRLSEVLSDVRQEDSSSNDRLDVTDDLEQKLILWSLFLSPLKLLLSGTSVICGLLICDFANMRLRIGLFSRTYPLNYSYPWSFYMRIRYMRAHFLGPYLSHLTRETCTLA